MNEECQDNKNITYPKAYRIKSIVNYIPTDVIKELVARHTTMMIDFPPDEDLDYLCRCYYTVDNNFNTFDLYRIRPGVSYEEVDSTYVELMRTYLIKQIPTTQASKLLRDAGKGPQ